MFKLRAHRARRLAALPFLLLIVLALALAAACGDDDDEAAPAAAAAPAQEQAPAPAPAAEPEPAPAPAPEPTVSRGVIKIGLIGSLSGKAIPWGVPTSQAVHLAVDEINRGECAVCHPDGGVQVGDTIYSLEIEERDIRSESDLAVPAVIDLVRDLGVQYIVGPMFDDYAVLTQEITNEAGVIMFSGSTAHQTYLTTESAALGGSKHYLFKVHPNDIVKETIFAQAVSDYIPEAKTSVLLIPNDAVGQTAPPFWVWAEREAGREPLDVILYPPGTTDFSPFMTQVKAAGADVAFLWYIATDMYEMIRVGAELDAADAYYLHALDPIDFWDSFPNGYEKSIVFACMMACWESGLANVNEYWDRFRASGGERGSIVGHALMTGPYIKVLAEAWVNTGTVTDTDAIAAYIETVRFQGPYGEIYFDSRHIVEHGFELCHAAGGETKADMTCQWYDPEPGLPAALPDVEMP